MNFYETLNTIYGLSSELQSFNHSCDLNKYIDNIIDNIIYLYDNTYICNSCGRVLSDERAFTDDGKIYCHYCYEEHKPNPIKEYHETKGTLKFKNLEERFPIYYRGLEVEVELETITESVYDVLRKADSSLFRFEEDGSLNDGGFEIITAPMSRAYWSELGFFKLEKLIDNLNQVSNLNAWDGGRCGLHIHFNRCEISNTAQKFLKEFMIKNHGFIEKVSGRDSFEYCRKPVKDDYELDYAGELYNHSRYLTLNFTPDTLEFRFWRGTLKTENIKASVQLTEDLIEFAELASEHDIEPTESSFITYITANNPELNNFKNERRARWERHYGVISNKRL